MLNFNIDMAEQEKEAKNFDLLPPATYKVRVEEVIDLVSSKGTKGVQVKMKTMDTETERTINYFLYESSIMETIIFKMAKCFGVAQPKTTDDFIGKIGNIKYLNKEQDGEKVGEINPFRGFLPKEDSEQPIQEDVGTPSEDGDSPF